MRARRGDPHAARSSAYEDFAPGRNRNIITFISHGPTFPLPSNPPYPLFPLPSSLLNFATSTPPLRNDRLPSLRKKAGEIDFQWGRGGGRLRRVLVLGFLIVPYGMDRRSEHQDSAVGSQSGLGVTRHARIGDRDRWCWSLSAAGRIGRDRTKRWLRNLLSRNQNTVITAGTPP